MLIGVMGGASRHRTRWLPRRVRRPWSGRRHAPLPRRLDKLIFTLTCCRCYSCGLGLRATTSVGRFEGSNDWHQAHALGVVWFAITSPEKIERVYDDHPIRRPAALEAPTGPTSVTSARLRGRHWITFGSDIRMIDQFYTPPELASKWVGCVPTSFEPRVIADFAAGAAAQVKMERQDAHLGQGVMSVVAPPVSGLQIAMSLPPLGRRVQFFGQQPLCLAKPLEQLRSSRPGAHHLQQAHQI